ncbi:hypothetical protein, partial [Bradyrhizobium japonicum]|uniref:hypothetical protein n=1 Tax=Bradyrhizobium japonicum TaxID=375 RepID=UPI001AEF1111
LSFSQNKPARILSPPNQHVGKRITWRYLGTDPSHPERKFVALVDSLNLERGERLWRMQVGKAGRSRRWC